MQLRFCYRTPGTLPPFQYPQSDRRRCNAVSESELSPPQPLSVSSIGSEAMQPGGGDRVPGRADRLSVSSIGSEAMQPDLRELPHLLVAAFSILNRIGGDATNMEILNGFLSHLLSVSSIGSEAMQQRKLDAPGGQSIPFQYPQSDRRRCNSDIHSDIAAAPKYFQYPQSDRRRCNKWSSISFPSRDCLSVSSIGSEAMQRKPRRRPNKLPTSFSILNRIGGDATTSGIWPYSSTALFQYPQSDRRRCNFQFVVVALLTQPAFSILNRIGGDATTESRRE